MSSDQRYVIDTHVLVWYLAGSKKLKPEVVRILKEIQSGKAQGLISVIVLAELEFLFEKKKVTISLASVLEALDKNENFRIVNLDRGQIELLPRLRDIPEMHDRIIASVAIINDCRIITRDEELRKSGLIKTVWK